MSSNQLSEMYQLMTTNVLYKLDPAFDNMQLRSAISSSLISFNRTQVTLVNGYLIYMAYKLQLITNYNIPCILYQVWPVWTLGNEESSRLITKFGSLSVGLQAILLNSSTVYPFFCIQLLVKQVTSILLPGISGLYYGEETSMTNHPSIRYIFLLFTSTYIQAYCFKNELGLSSDFFMCCFLIIQKMSLI